MRRFVTALTVLTATVTFTACQPNPWIPQIPTLTPPATNGEVDVRVLLDNLPTARENRRGYTREAFPHWRDPDRNGCNTREDVLITESVTPAQVDPFGCRVVTGDWVSVYDQETTTNPGDLDVDHVVPLAEAWGSGARNWTRARREAFANDTSDPRTLIAVTARSNRAKGDKDPAGWLPPNRGYVCEYVANWVAVKYRWGLSVDRTERQSIETVLNGCGTMLVTAPVRV